VSFRVPKGEILGVLGRNGSGKSTMLRVVGGVYAPSRGTVRLSGTVGSLFEMGGLGNQYIAGRQYAERVLRMQGASGRELHGLLAEIREFSELGDYFDRRLHTYSAGMAARLYFATAMALPREVFLIDELLSVGDAHFQAKSWKRVRERLLQGASGILVTHDWSAVIKLCRRAIVLDGGAIVAEGRADVVVARYLGLPEPDRSIAELSDLRPLYTGVCGEDLEIPVAVASHRENDLELAFSIELMRLGVGWEIMLMSQFEPIGRFLGRRETAIRIPRLPVSPGRYSLNLFLRSLGPDGYSTADARTWTAGCGLDLQIGGEPGIAWTRVPTRWSAQPYAHA